MSKLPAEFADERDGKRQTISLPWKRLTEKTKMLRPGTVTIIGGPAGHGKSLLAMQIAMNLRREGHQFSYLPLEDRKVDFERRALAVLSQNWEVISDDSSTAENRLRLYEIHKVKLFDLMCCVTENPRLPVIGEDGKPTVPAVPYQEILNWITEVLSVPLGERIKSVDSRVVFIDPWAQIDFGEHAWKGEKDFMRRMVGIAAHSGGSVVVVAHTAKRGGKNSMIPISGEDIQGAAELRRLSHTIILLDAHEAKTSEVYRGDGTRESVWHDRTVIVDKARNSDGRGCRLAFIMPDPVFQELGVIAPKSSMPISMLPRPVYEKEDDEL